MSILDNKIVRIILIIISSPFILNIACYIIKGINGLGKVVGTYIRLLGNL